MFDGVFAECVLREAARGEVLRCLRERIGHARQVAGRVDIAAEMIRRLDAIFDAIESGGERRCKGEIRIAVRAGDAAFDAQAPALADDAKPRGAVVALPASAWLFSWGICSC